jgi:tetratricopeptide (TPR) repeat protein
MRFPRKRFDFVSHKPRSRLHIGKILLFLLIASAIGTGGFWFFTKGLDYISLSNASVRETILALWDARDYQEIIRITEDELRKNPMDAYNLIFNGFAYFYTGVNEIITEEKLAHIDAAITSLRRVRLYEKPPLAGEVEYVLGKAYYQKGEYYSDLSVQYMTSSIEKDFVGQDSFEYLGLAYNNLGDYEKSINYLLKAGETNPSDLLFLALAQTYYQTGDKTAAEEYLMRAINKSQDSSLIQKARSLLGDIYLQNKEYLKSEEQYLKIIEANPQNAADAHFYLGEIYLNLGDTVKARAFWRRAARIDPNHSGALGRLYRRN